MALLGSIQYDPATAVSKATTAATAMAAFDTTNARIAITAPGSGKVFWRIKATTHGATTFPRILLGVMSGASVLARMTPMGDNRDALATTQVGQEASGLITGLTPGNAYNLDAAWCCEVAVSSTGIKYGGPNNTSGNNAWGALIYEVWSVPNLLDGKLYDPASAATIDLTSTAGLKAMTAMDTTNLRLSVNAPASGKIGWRVRTQIHGSTTWGQTLLGVLSGATVVGRAAPVYGLPQTAVNTNCCALEAGGIITGLTPSGAYTLDAAYANQVVMGAGGIKHGGPDNNTANNAFGGTAFELYSV